MISDMYHCFSQYCNLYCQIDVLGTAHYWDQTIDTVLAIQLIVGIGLSVDYSAHIGHCFMTVTGDRNSEYETDLFSHISMAL